MKVGKPKYIITTIDKVANTTINLLMTTQEMKKLVDMINADIVKLKPESSKTFTLIKGQEDV